MRESHSHPLPPGPRGKPLFGNVLDAWSDPISLLTRSVAAHGDIVLFKFGWLRYALVNHPDGIRHVLVENAKNYTKSRNYQGLKLVLGDGLLTSEGDFWRRQRKLAAPAFHRERLAGFAQTMASDTADLVTRWDALGAREADVHEDMMRLTLRIVGRTLFGLDVDGDAKGVGQALGVAIKFANDYVEQMVRLPLWVPLPRHREFLRSKATLDALVARIVDERRRRGDLGEDFLSMLLAARDDAGEAMTEKQLRDEVMTIVLAGHETTANAMTWTLWLLARHPDVARRVRDEVDAVLGDRALPGLSDLPRMPSVARTIDESMRLYPPAWAFERQAIADDVVMGYRIPKGAIVGISPYVLHRREAAWDDPEAFDIDRFDPERTAARPKWTYLPFGGGPRMCIGAGFATMEAQIILAMLVRRFDFALSPDHSVQLEPLVTLRPKGGLVLRVKPRDPAPAAEASAA